MSIFEKAKKAGAVECTEEDYDYALGVLPPVYFGGLGFAMGEQYDATRWYCFWIFGGRFWCMLTTLDVAKAIVHINENGITYNEEETLS